MTSNLIHLIRCNEDIFQAVVSFCVMFPSDIYKVIRPGKAVQAFCAAFHVTIRRLVPSAFYAFIRPLQS